MVTVDHATVQAVAEKACDADPGLHVEGVAIGADGVVALRMDTWTHRQRAADALRELGYHVTTVADTDLSVTGWDLHRLIPRAEQLEARVRQLEFSLGAVADLAATGMLHHVQAGLSMEEATRRVKAALVAAAGGHHVASPPPDGDIHAAGAAKRELLIRVAAAENTIPTLIRDHLTIAEQTCRLFTEFHDEFGHPPETAARWAAESVLDGVRATLTNAAFDADPQYREEPS